MKDLFGKVWVWAKRHTFHFIISLLLVACAFSFVGQQAMIFNLRGELNKFKQNTVENINTTKEELSTNIQNNKIYFDKRVQSTAEAFNARVDTLSKTVGAEEKRRELISNIRNAINDNIGHTIGVRDLNRIANSVIDYAYQYNLRIPEVLAQIKVESDFKVKAESRAGAQGLMQIMPGTLKYIGYEMPDAPPRMNPWNIYHNIKAGCFYMAEQIGDFGTYDEALRAYNWGPDRLKKYNAGEIITMPQETTDYVPRVHKYIEIFNRYGLE